MDKWLNPIIFLAGLFVIGNSNATLIECASCTSVDMKHKAEDIAGRGANGRHIIKVINIPNSDYKVYQVDKIGSGGGRDPNADFTLITTELTVSNMDTIKHNITTLNSEVAAMKAAVGTKVVLPDDFTYRSAAEALRYPTHFADAAADFMNNHNNWLQAYMFGVRFATNTLASNMSVSVGTFLSVSTSFASGTQTVFQFTDGSTITVQYNYVFNTAEGIVINIVAGTQARDKNGKLIPKNSLETRNYATDGNSVDVGALAGWFSSIGIIVTGHNQGQGASCLPHTLACTTDGSGCEITYRCN